MKMYVIWYVVFTQLANQTQNGMSAVHSLFGLIYALFPVIFVQILLGGYQLFSHDVA